MQELPRKAFYRLSEVCEYTDTQPYVLRFWQSEFPQLKPDTGAGGQPIYRKRDVELVCRIKELLHEEEYSLEDARKKLAAETSRGRKPGSSRGKLHAAPKETHRPAGKAPTLEQPARAPFIEPKKLERRPLEPIEAGENDFQTVPRQRYQAAIDEIDHLRTALKEAQKEQRRADVAAGAAREHAEQERHRANTAMRYLERLREILG